MSFSPFIEIDDVVIDLNFVFCVKKRLNRSLDVVGLIFYTKTGKEIEVIIFDDKVIKSTLELATAKLKQIQSGEV